MIVTEVLSDGSIVQAYELNPGAWQMRRDGKRVGMLYRNRRGRWMLRRSVGAEVHDRSLIGRTSRARVIDAICLLEELGALN